MNIESNIWWTRKSRIQAEKRLLENAFQAQLLQLWYSLASASIAIYYLQFQPNSELSGVAWVIFSVLALAMSGFVSGLSFKERASLIKECYETLNSLYHRLKNDKNEKEALKEYNQVIGVCENHKDVDYYRALCDEYLNSDPEKLDRKPTRYMWCVVVLSLVRRFFILAIFYSLPAVIFYYLS